MCSCASYVSRGNDDIDYVARSENRFHPEIAILRHFFAQRVIIWGSRNNFATYLSYGFEFGLKDHERSEIESVWGNFQTI